MGRAEVSRAEVTRASATGSDTAQILAAHGLRLDLLTAATSDLFAVAGIDAIVLKGVSFARLFYPEGGRSPSGDVDVLVRRRDLDGAHTALTQAGYEFVEPVESDETNNSALTFVRRVNDRTESWVDLHWSMHGSMADPDLVWSALFAESEPTKVVTSAVRVLSPAGCALHVALHAARSGSGGKRGADLRRAIEMLTPADWARAAELARTIEVEDGFAAGLRRDSDGAALAAQLSLTTTPPEPWRFAGDEVPRGAKRTRLLLLHPSPANLARLARPSLFPSRDRVRRQARSRLSRRFVVFGYLSYWGAALRAVPAALRVGWAIHRRGRYFRGDGPPGAAAPTRTPDDSARKPG